MIGNILPGAVEEVGLLCCDLVSVNPKESGVHLLAPIMELLLSSLSDSPKTGFSGHDEEISVVDFKVVCMFNSWKNSSFNPCDLET